MPSEWRSVTTLPQLGPEELQLWQIRLDGSAGNPELCRRHLSAVELERADRLRAGQVTMQFVMARAGLRILLGNLLSVLPNLVPLILSAYGKPEISPTGDCPLFFNVAHSRETILIALCRASHVGIDVEYFDRNTDALEIAHNSFTRREFGQIQEIVDPQDRQRAFFRCWTRKEAVLKADGRGLSLSLDMVEVPIDHPAISVPVLIREGPGEDAGLQPWFVSDIASGEEIAAAFAVRIRNLRVGAFNFPTTLLSGE